MKAVNIATGATPTLISAAGNRDFLHIYNASDTTIYLGYDDNSAANLTTSNGMPIAAGEKAVLDNIGPRIIYNKAIYGIHGSAGNKEVRVQGDS